MTLEFHASDDTDDLETWASILMTPEMRKEWDPAVESSQVIEICDPSTRIVKTNFTLGWPAKSVSLNFTLPERVLILE